MDKPVSDPRFNTTKSQESFDSQTPGDKSFPGSGK